MNMPEDQTLLKSQFPNGFTEGPFLVSPKFRNITGNTCNIPWPIHHSTLSFPNPPPAFFGRVSKIISFF